METPPSRGLVPPGLPPDTLFKPRPDGHISKWHSRDHKARRRTSFASSFTLCFAFWGYFSCVAIKKEQSENWYKSIKRYLAPYEEGFFRLFFYSNFNLITFFSVFLLFLAFSLSCSLALCLFLVLSHARTALNNKHFMLQFI